MAIDKKLTKSKADEFSSYEAQLAEFCKALSHPARIAILKALAKRGECVCGEIVEVLPLAQSTVSQHLKQLRDSGLIDGEVEGAKSCYCVNQKELKRLFALFAKLDAKLSSDLKKFSDCC